MKHVLAFGVLALCLLLPGVAAAQQDMKVSVEDEEQIKLERTALNVATNILRLFGSERAFFFAAAFGAGMTEQMDNTKCPAAIKQAEEMIGKLKVLTSR